LAATLEVDSGELGADERLGVSPGGPEGEIDVRVKGRWRASTPEHRGGDELTRQVATQDEAARHPVPGAVRAGLVPDVEQTSPREQGHEPPRIVA
jgi:hypothetical protein